MTALLLVPAVGAWAQDTEPPGALVVESAPRWGPSPAGAWTAYSVRIRNDTAASIEADLVLRPNLRPPPGGPLQIVSTPSAVVATGYVPVEANGSRSKGGSGRPATWPVHRNPIALGPRSTNEIIVWVVEAPYGYRTAIQSRAGRVLAMSPLANAPAARTKWTLAVLSNAVPDAIGRPHFRARFTTDLALTHLTAAAEFPNQAAGLIGLQAILVDDFDSTALTDAQLDAMRDFVGLGGVLVLGGGTPWPRSVAPLPDDLLPIRPRATRTVPVAALTAVPDPGLNPPAPSLYPEAEMTVAVGELRRGITTVRSHDGTPLVVVARYGSGHVVQLTFDPFAAPFNTDGALAGLGRDRGLIPALSALGSACLCGMPGGPTADDLWSPVFEPPPLSADPGWPGWPGWNVGLLGLYVLGAGPLMLLVVRRGLRAFARWRAVVILPVIALLLAGVSGLAKASRERSRQPTLENVLEVRRFGARGTAMIGTFHGVLRPDGQPFEMALPRRALVSSAMTQPGVPRTTGPPGTPPALNTSAFGQPISEGQFPGGGVLPGEGASAEVRSGGEGPSRLLARATDPGFFRTAQTLSLIRDSGNIDADLQVVSGSGEFRVRGRLSNRTGEDLRTVTAYVGTSNKGSYVFGNPVVLADLVKRGATIDIDVTVPDPAVRQVPRDALSVVGRTMAAAADFYRPAADQIPVVALLDSTPKGLVAKEGRRLALAVKLVPINNENGTAVLVP